MNEPDQSPEPEQVEDADVTEVNVKMPMYDCHKKVWALRIAVIVYDSGVARIQDRETDGSAMITPVEGGYAPFKVDQNYLRKHHPVVGGYYVVYKDGYKSFSPALAFEDGYTRVVDPV
jgi:hypothetical protein